VSAKDGGGVELKGAALHTASTRGSKGVHAHAYKLLTLRSRILDSD